MITTQAILVDKQFSPDGKVVFLRFKVQDTFDFKEGQFMMISSDSLLDEQDKVIKRAYSIATTHQEMEKRRIVGTIVKQTSEHGMSAFLTRDIQLGDEVTLTGALGHFVDHGRASDYLLVSMGSGLTPLYALYSHLIFESQQFGKIANIFGERYAGSLLKKIVSDFAIHHEKVNNYCFLSQELEEYLPVGWRKGRVQDGVADALDFLGKENLAVFLCGKPEMVDGLREILAGYGIAQEDIFFEKY